MFIQRCHNYRVGILIVWGVPQSRIDAIPPSLCILHITRDVTYSILVIQSRVDASLGIGYVNLTVKHKINIGPILDDRMKEKVMKPRKGAHSGHSVCVSFRLCVCKQDIGHTF